MWWNAFGACPDMCRPLCLGRNVPLVPLPGLRFLFTQDFPVEAEIGRYYETPDYISHTDTRKGAMNSGVPLGAQLYAGTQGTPCAP